ncbi:MAG: N-acetyltransferase [Nitrospiraceae bacterium]|nr:MAG: N-acetyltransferase [Nitrospiraceae bacterium]
MLQLKREDLVIGDNGAVRLVVFEQRHLDRTFVWFNDSDLARLLNRRKSIDLADHTRWFETLNDRQDCLYCAIETCNENKHIGNVWLRDINLDHKKAEISILIGDREELSKGLGSMAIQLLTEHAFNNLRLHRLYANVLAFNVRACRAFEKAGFKIEGRLRQDRWMGDHYEDILIMGKLHEK